MLLDLSRFRSGTEHIERLEDPQSVVRDGDDFQVITPVALVADVHKDGPKVRLTGRVATTLQLDCSRCLDPFPIPVNAPFEMLFLPVSENTGAIDQEVAEDDLGVSFYKDDQIDLADVIREQLYLALPMKPLCAPACQGLCPVCGKNRNREPCACEMTWVDPRLEPLRKLKEPS